MYKRLLIPLDGTPAAEAALPVVLALVERGGGSVLLLHLIEKSAPDSVHGQPHLTGSQAAEEYLCATARRAFPPEVTVCWHVHEESVADVSSGLARHEQELAPDLIVMCPHGRRDWSDRWFGSLAQRVIGLGATPLLMLQPGAGGTVKLPFKQIMAPLDWKTGHDQVLTPASTLAQASGALLHLLSIIPTAQTASGEDALAGGFMPKTAREILALREEQAAAELGCRLAGLKAAGLNCSAETLRGDPLERMVQIVNERKPDVVALGTHGKSGISAFWEGSFGARLFSRIQTSLLLVPVQADK